jgi:16S rRNA (cytosine967-C5)-methyltransferase
MQLLQENRNRLGLSAELVQADALNPPFHSSFDRVVLDVPCTGTGTLRKNPELKWRISAGEIARLADQGLAMLEQGSRLVRVGGLLTMVTCSLEPEENADVVSRFLATNRDFELLPLQPELPAALREWVVDTGRWRILPAGVHDGFTVHALRRNR